MQYLKTHLNRLNQEFHLKINHRVLNYSICKKIPSTSDTNSNAIFINHLESKLDYTRTSMKAKTYCLIFFPASLAKANLANWKRKIKASLRVYLCGPI